MKDDIIKSFAKNREDAFDALHLRAREKKVLFGLIFVLLITLVYEFREPIYNEIVGVYAEEELLQLQTKTKFRPADLKGLRKLTEKISEEFPQFSVRIQRELDNLNEIIKFAEDKKEKENFEKFAYVLNSLYRFAKHPATVKNKRAEDLEKEVGRVASKANVELSLDDEILPLVFDKKIEPGNINKRNLFEYGEI
ncbi:hypothetical protein EOM81_07765 [bacterium]|nr:hypothetical protein [bacterium]